MPYLGASLLCLVPSKAESEAELCPTGRSEVPIRGPVAIQSQLWMDCVVSGLARVRHRVTTNNHLSVLDIEVGKIPSNADNSRDCSR